MGAAKACRGSSAGAGASARRKREGGVWRGRKSSMRHTEGPRARMRSLGIFGGGMRDGGGGQEVRWATNGDEICSLNGKIQLRHPPCAEPPGHRPRRRPPPPSSAVRPRTIHNSLCLPSRHATLFLQPKLRPGAVNHLSRVFPSKSLTSMPRKLAHYALTPKLALNRNLLQLRRPMIHVTPPFTVFSMAIRQSSLNPP